MYLHRPIFVARLGPCAVQSLNLLYHEHPTRLSVTDLAISILGPSFYYYQSWLALTRRRYNVAVPLLDSLPKEPRKIYLPVSACIIQLVLWKRYKEAVQVPQNDESSKGQCCGQEIARELQSAIPDQSATNSARWDNPAGLLMLEMTDSHKELVDSNKKLLDSVKELKDRVAALESDVPKSKATYAHSLAIRNRFFSSFLRDHHPAKYTPSWGPTTRLLPLHRCHSLRCEHLHDTIWLTTRSNFIAT